ncbi:MAG: DUF4097 family beta strand repeat-containing protein [Candidatus Izimaplasma sp.]|nr:DUF4097 family beta strand repeat-containing protein [Candidatus Izimaplasma bacterium]
MKRKFLTELEKYLAPLGVEERNEILRFYEERFQSGKIYENKTESEIVDELETPKQIAINVLEEYGYSINDIKTEDNSAQKKELSYGRIAILLIVDFFIVISAIPALIGAFIGLVAGWGGLVFMIFTPEIHGVQPLINLILIGAAILWLFLLFWLYDVIVTLITWIVRWHLKAFNYKDPAKILKKMHHLKISTYLRHHRSLKQTKSLITVFALLGIFIGGIASIVQYGGLNRSQFNEPLETYETSYDMTGEILASENLTINIDIYHSEIEFRVTDTEEIVVYVKEKESVPLEVAYNEENNLLSITSDMERPFLSWNFISFFFQDNPELIIEIPNNLSLQSITVKSLNGKLDMNDIDLIGNLNVDIINGDIDLNNLSVDNIYIETVNGRIILKDIEANNDFEVDLDNGSINVRRISALNYDFHNTNGDIILRDIDVSNQVGETLRAQLTNGDIELQNVYVNEVTLKNTNGDIDFHNDDLTFVFDKVDANTTNGSEDINVPKN